MLFSSFFVERRGGEGEKIIILLQCRKMELEVTKKNATNSDIITVIPDYNIRSQNCPSVPTSQFVAKGLRACLNL